MITIVESRNVVTRICTGDEARARLTHQKLRGVMANKGWLSVSLANISEHPHRGASEMERVVELIANMASGE